MLGYGKYEYFVMQMLYLYVLCASCGSSQYCILHDLQFVNAGQGCERRLYEIGTLQSPPSWGMGVGHRSDDSMPENQLSSNPQ